MDKKSVLKTCELLYATQYLPIACYDNEGNPEQLSCSFEEFDNVLSTIDGKSDERDATLVYGLIGIYGRIRVKEENLVIVTGPFVNKTPTEELFDSVIHTYSLPWDKKDELKQFILSIPRYSLNRFLNFVSLLHYLFNGKEISPSEYFEASTDTLVNKIGEKHSDEIFNEEQIAHNTYDVEQSILTYVSEGDVTGMQSLFGQIAKAGAFTEGKVANDTLRQSKNIFIGFISMVGKVGAIGGNLDIEQTYQLIDLYTQECEKCVSVSEVNMLRYSAIMDFTRRVAEQKHPTAYSDSVYKALQYIKTHTNQPIGVEDVVAHSGKSRSALMDQFKKETGTTIGKYIVKAKLQESRLLLAYSERSLANIASFLYFSTQSHFQNLFKKEYGMTPLEYRKRHRK